MSVSVQSVINFVLTYCASVKDTAGTTCVFFYKACGTNNLQCQNERKWVSTWSQDARFCIVCVNVCMLIFMPLPSLLAKYDKVVPLLSWTLPYSHCPGICLLCLCHQYWIRFRSPRLLGGLEGGVQSAGLGLGLKSVLGPLWLEEREVGRPPYPHGLWWRRSRRRWMKTASWNVRWSLGVEGQLLSVCSLSLSLSLSVSLSLSHIHTHTHTHTHSKITLTSHSGSVQRSVICEGVWIVCLCVCGWGGYVRVHWVWIADHTEVKQRSLLLNPLVWSHLSITGCRGCISHVESDRTHAVTSSAADRSSVKLCSLQAWAGCTHPQRLQCVSHKSNHQFSTSSLCGVYSTFFFVAIIITTFTRGPNVKCM